MAKEYIEREAVLKKRRTLTEYDEGGWDAKVAVVEVDDIKDIPAADVVEVKHSVWVYDGKPIHCKKCGFEPNYTLTEKNSVYCPHCGRRMDGGN